MQKEKVQYPYLLAWDIMMGSYQGWKELMQETAAKENAPATAVYRNSANNWQTYENISRQETKDRIDQIMKEYDLG